MLRVLTLSSLFPDASRPTFGVFVEKQTLALAARDDVELEVVAPIGVAPWPLSRHRRYRHFAAVPERENWKGVTVHRPRFATLPMTGGRFAPALMARALLPLLERIRDRFPFDVIDTEFFYPDGPAAMRLAQRLRVPFSIKARGSDINFWGRQEGCADQVRAAGQAANGLLAVSESLKREMVGLGLPAERIRVHYTGIDRERFRPLDRVLAKRELGVDGPLIVTVGALIALKGQQFAIDAVASLPEVNLWMVGEGPDRASLEARVARGGNADRIRLLGNRPHSEVAKLLAAANVMVLPSASEGLANAWVEALACGTPIVICDVGGAREVVDRPEAGALVAREPSAIAKVVATILDRAPSQDAVRAAALRFSWERNCDDLFDHLSGLSGSMPRRR